MTAQEFLARLPRDEETADRALEFRAMVAESRESPEAWSLAKSIYHMAGSQDWPCSSLHDVHMLMYSLSDNPDLVPEVRSDVDRCLRRLYGEPHPVLTRWIRMCGAQTKRHGFDRAN